MPIPAKEGKKEKPNPFSLSIEPDKLSFHREKANDLGYRSLSKYMVDCLDAVARNPGLLNPVEETTPERFEKIIASGRRTDQEVSALREEFTDFYDEFAELKKLVELMASKSGVSKKELAKIKQKDSLEDQEDALFGSG